MAVQFIDSMPGIIPVTVAVPFSLFTLQNQSILLAGAGGLIPVIPIGVRLLGVMVHKETAFDTNTIAFGHGTVAAQRETLASFAEVASTTKGVVEATAWRPPDMFGDLLLTAARGIYARLGAGAVPIAGQIRLTLLLHYLSGRAVL